MTAEIGAVGVLEHIVRPVDLATAWANDVPVMATPVLLWLAELACMKAIEGSMPDGRMTLGVAHDMRHLAPTPEGGLITLRAELVESDGKLLTFQVRAHDGSDTVLEGRHTRGLVARQRFLDRVAAKAADHAA